MPNLGFVKDTVVGLEAAVRLADLAAAATLWQT